MKFRSETGAPLPQGDLEGEFRRSGSVGAVRAGETCLFYPGLTGVGVLPYGELKQLYLRKEQVVARMCCGVVDASPIFLMAVDTGGQVHKTSIRDTDSGKALLAQVAQRAPHVEIGYRGTDKE